MTAHVTLESPQARHPVRPDVLLTVSSLIAILLLSIHIPEDFVLGFDKSVVRTPYWILIFVVWLVGVLLLRERLIGRIIILLGGIFAIGMPWVHLNGRGYGDDFIKSGGALQFLWTLVALGIAGSLIIILSIRELLSLRRTKVQ